MSWRRCALLWVHSSYAFYFCGFRDVCYASSTRSMAEAAGSGQARAERDSRTDRRPAEDVARSSEPRHTRTTEFVARCVSGRGDHKHWLFAAAAASSSAHRIVATVTRAYTNRILDVLVLVRFADWLRSPITCPTEQPPPFCTDWHCPGER